MDCCLIYKDPCKCDGDVDKNIFAPKLINVTIKAVPSEPAITPTKVIIAVPCGVPF